MYYSYLVIKLPNKFDGFHRFVSLLSDPSTFIAILTILPNAT